MNPEMQRMIEVYAARLRRGMRGATPDAMREAEAEIRAHIEDALAARGASSVGALRDVLDRLGPPEDYGRDLVLYMMVDRGYREWSVPHMVRSTLFWSLTTLAGAVVVLIFGMLYALALSLITAGAMRVVAPWAPPLAPSDAGGLPLGSLASAMPAAGLAATGIALAATLTVIVRWFVGQYVIRARPHTLAAGDADGGWARRTGRRILLVAVTGFAVTLAAGFASGAYRFDGLRPALPPDYLASPLALLSAAGMVVLLLAPVLGMLWSALAERKGAARP